MLTCIPCFTRTRSAAMSSRYVPRTACQEACTAFAPSSMVHQTWPYTNNPFDQYQIAQPMYGDPFYLTLEERDKVYYADLNGMGANYPVYRDIFMFQCLIGCRVSDLNRLTKANIVDGCVEYIPQKTKLEHAGTVRVPLNQKALDILERYKDLEEALLRDSRISATTRK